MGASTHLSFSRVSFVFCSKPAKPSSPFELWEEAREDVEALEEEEALEEGGVLEEDEVLGVDVGHGKWRAKDLRPDLPRLRC